MTTQTLNAMMEFDHVIRVNADGSIDDQTDAYAPEVRCGTDADGQILAEHEQDLVESVRSQGWSLLTGFTGQSGYRGPIMHPSEYVGGALEEAIRTTPGLYAVVMVNTDDDDDEPAGWAVVYRES